MSHRWFRVVQVAVAILAALVGSIGAAASWCVALNNVSQQTLQTALDYACGAGADCTPIQSNGLCYLPNTIQAHASYAFNSYYQRKAMAPGSCDFGGAAAVSLTDPSYGSCVYPSSPSNAGSTTPFTPPGTNTPSTSTPMTPTFGAGGTVGGGGGNGFGTGTGTGTGIGGFSPLGSVPADNSRGHSPSFSLITLPLICLLPLLYPPI